MHAVVGTEGRPRWFWLRRSGSEARTAAFDVRCRSQFAGGARRGLGAVLFLLTSVPLTVHAQAAGTPEVAPGAGGGGVAQLTPTSASAPVVAPDLAAEATIAPAETTTATPDAPEQPAPPAPPPPPSQPVPQVAQPASEYPEEAWEYNPGGYRSVPQFSKPRHAGQRLRYRGIYVQPRFMGLFGVNFPQQFAENCPGLDCDVSPPIGFAGGGLIGWGFKNTGVHFLVLGMTDSFGVDVELPSSATTQGGASGGAGGGFGFQIDDDGVSIDGSLFGDGLAAGLVGSDGNTGRAHAKRTGVAFGAGVQQAWLRRPVRINTGLSAGAVKRTVRGTSSSRDSRAEYTAPFLMGDVGFAFGRHKAFLVGAMAFVEFVPKLRLERNGVFQNVPVITHGPQLFVGPYIAMQWGPRGRPVPADEEWESDVE